jgi:hypothetical protein
VHHGCLLRVDLEEEKRRRGEEEKRNRKGFDI